jgi:catechol 2,3-dioxygenase-like lactoylglutathione lyase family enzyme
VEYSKLVLALKTRRKPGNGTVFGMDINVFEDTAVAKLMLPYTNGKECPRYAALAVNMEGGGGYEIWQHTSMEPKAPVFDVQLGDTGIYICKMKCRDVQKAFEEHRRMEVNILGEISKTPGGNQHYFVKDPYNNIFEVVEEATYFAKEKSVTGGVFGTVIGVSDIEKALKVYADILQYDEVVYDETNVFEDLKHLPGGKQKYRRVLLKHKPRTGSFSKLLGSTQIELVQALERTPKKIYQDRIWGELGYILLCFDIIGMGHLEKECEEKGFPFTVNSANSFDMGVAAGHFSYISDPDGTPIEFVETHKLPIIEKLGWYMNLKGRSPKKSLPKWMINTLRWNRIKN